MQSKISTFFKHSLSPSSRDILDAVSGILTQEPEITVTYKRKIPKQQGEIQTGLHKNACEKHGYEDNITKSEQTDCIKVVNKKRNYAQLHLDVGQSNFLWRTCTTCGFNYAPGVESDETVHKTFHKNYTHGLPFKGWRSERIIDEIEKGRIILLQDGDPPAQRNKVQEVVNMMEMDLGEGWILTKHCKVYLYISSQRITGCLVAEPIKKAYRIHSSSKGEKCDMPTTENGKKKKKSTTLRFGGVSLQRQIIKKDSVEKRDQEGSLDGVIVRNDEAVPALCGVRAIWVSPSNRRKHMAFNLLDATRKSFCEGLILDRTEVAFSQPTVLGKALISSYTRTSSFLVYTTADNDID